MTAPWDIFLDPSLCSHEKCRWMYWLIKHFQFPLNCTRLSEHGSITINLCVLIVWRAQLDLSLLQMWDISCQAKRRCWFTGKLHGCIQDRCYYGPNADEQITDKKMSVQEAVVYAQESSVVISHSSVVCHFSSELPQYEGKEPSAPKFSTCEFSVLESDHGKEAAQQRWIQLMQMTPTTLKFWSILYVNQTTM